MRRNFDEQPLMFFFKDGKKGKKSKKNNYKNFFDKSLFSFESWESWTTTMISRTMMKTRPSEIQISLRFQESPFEEFP